MKKVSMFVFVVFTVFMFVACGDSDPKPATSGGDESEISDDEGGNDTAEDSEVVNDEENKPAEQDDSTTPGNKPVNDDDPGEPIEEPDETEEPDGNNDPAESGFEKVGTFELSFNGPVHESVGMGDMTNLGGEGAAAFVYNDQPINFEKISIGTMNIFPMAMINNGIVIVWLDSFGMGDLTGAVQKQVFGISIPQDTEIGSGKLSDARIYAFYGDMTVNVKESKFDINCVRAVTNVGDYGVTANDGSNLTMTASGDLLEPAAGASYLPYPACE